MHFQYSPEALDIMLESWAPASRTQYECYISRWITFCSKKKIDPFRAEIAQGVEFLVWLFSSLSLGYSAVNTARSALSSLLPRRNGTTFGKDPGVSRLLKGIFRLRPSLPRYTVTWDVSIVLTHFISLHRSGDNSRKGLTMKLATLLCLLSGQRSQSLELLKLECMHLDKSRAIFYFPVLLKTSRPKFHQAPLEFKAFVMNSVLCPVSCLESYLILTGRESKESRTGPLFLSYAHPFLPVKASTIARYVRTMMKEAGIDTVTFSAHSARGASTSGVKSKGLSMAHICKSAGWSGCQTFARHYNKPIQEEDFSSCLLRASVTETVRTVETLVETVSHDHGTYT